MSAESHDPAAAVDAANAVFGRHAGARALHAKGIVCAGHFVPSAEAAQLSCAAHFQGDRVPVIARFSNGGGDPDRPDWRTDPRGLALKFILPDGSRTDIVAVSAPVFPAATPDAFIDLLRAQAAGGAAMLGLIRRRPKLVSALLRSASSALPPVGFHTIDYHALHSYRLVNATGEGPWVRYHLRSTEPARRLSVAKASRLGDNYLTDGVHRHLARGPILFGLEADLAREGDAIDDPSAAWGKPRLRVRLGAITIDRVDPSPEQDGNILVFDPTRVTDGILLSDDPVLRFRSPAYRESVTRRTS